jgi:ribosome recycling factor
MLTIQVYDGGAVEAIEKAIQQSELGLNPSREGSLIRVVIPALNEERRKDLIKKVGKMSEEAKVALRNLRRDEVENVKKQVKSKEISEDDSRRAQDEIQKILDKVIAEVDAAAGAKEKELLEV